MDIISFQALFAEFQPQLKSYLYRLLTRRDAVDDLTHDTFIRAFDKLSTLNHDSNLKTDIREHIDFCFTCISRTLPIENQVTLILKDIYDFPIKEIVLILEKTGGVIKHLLNDARAIMTDIFEKRCALVNKEGMCHQCSHINAIFNPKQDQQEELMKLELVRQSAKFDRDELFKLRTLLVKGIDPLNSSGTDLQDIILKCTKTAIGEQPDFFEDR